jgi:hypothetical protein
VLTERGVQWIASAVERAEREAAAKAAAEAPPTS